MMRTLAIVLALACGVTAASAQSVPRYLDDPPFVRTPSMQRTAQVYPVPLLRNESGGRGMVDCLIGATGDLTDCRVLIESPVGLGVARAVLDLSKGFRAAKKTSDGTPTPGFRTLLSITLSRHKGGRVPVYPDYTPGRPAYVLTPNASGAPNATMPCPGPDNEQAVCHLHRMRWEQAPDFPTGSAHVARVGRTSGRLAMRCTVREDRSLANCTASTELAPQEMAAMDELLKLYRAPETSADGTPTADAPVLLIFDFDAITKVIKASALSQN